jgi:glycosyltransferase involved in cell wall biosynthesis
MPNSAPSFWPRVSYVMPTFNRAATFEKALLSVVEERQHNYPNLEIVVIDGASKDGTVELIQQHADAGRIDFWLSERDRSAAEAFNKGVQAAKGEIIRYCAADDTLNPGHTRPMIELLRAQPDTAVLGARANYFHVHRDGRREPQPIYDQLESGWLNLDEVKTWVTAGVFGPIETWFFRRSVFDRVGYLDTAFRICPDLEFAFRVVKAGLPFYIAPERIVNKCYYEAGGNLVGEEANRLREWREVVTRHVGAAEAARLEPTGPRVPLASRWFWGAWLAGVKRIKQASPTTYDSARRILRGRRSS